MPSRPSLAALAAGSLTRVIAVAMVALLAVQMPALGVLMALLIAGALVPTAVRMIRARRAGQTVTEALDWSGIRAELGKRVDALRRLLPVVETPRLERSDLAVRLPSRESARGALLAAREGFRPIDLVVIAVALAGLAWRIHGAFVAGDVADVHAYSDHYLRVKQGLPIYHGPGTYPYLPGWLGLEVVVGRLSELLAIPFWQAIRMLIVAADFVLVFAVWWLGTLLRGRAWGRIAAGVYALSPIAVLVSGYHGMFDALPLLLTVMAAGMAVRGSRNLLLAGALLGAAISLKPLAVLAVPVLMFAGAWTLSQRGVALVSCGLLVLAVSAPALLSDARAVFQSVLGYGGVNDQGISGLLRALWMERTLSTYLPGNMGMAISTDTRNLSVTLMAFTALAGWRHGLMRMCAGVYLAFLLTFGAVSTQYLLWPVPFLLLGSLPLAVAIVYSLGTAAGAIGFYLVFWPAIIFGESPPGVHVTLARHYLAGEIVAMLVIAISYAVTIAPVFRDSGWKRPVVLVGAGATILTAVAPLNQVVWLLQEWWKLGPR